MKKLRRSLGVYEGGRALTECAFEISWARTELVMKSSLALGLAWEIFRTLFSRVIGRSVDQEKRGGGGGERSEMQDTTTHEV